MLLILLALFELLLVLQDMTVFVDAVVVDAARHDLAYIVQLHWLSAVVICHRDFVVVSKSNSLLFRLLFYCRCDG